jgi:hypothetical protein
MFVLKFEICLVHINFKALENGITCSFVGEWNPVWKKREYRKEKEKSKSKEKENTERSVASSREKKLENDVRMILTGVENSSMTRVRSSIIASELLQGRERSAEKPKHTIVYSVHFLVRERIFCPHDSLKNLVHTIAYKMTGYYILQVHYALI